MKLFQKKRWLIQPSGSRALNWPIDVDFPPDDTMPPGWPRKGAPDVVLQVTAKGTNPCTVEIRCVDEYGEDTDICMCDMLILRATNQFGIRMRTDENEPYSKAALLKVHEYEKGKFGHKVNLYFELSKCYLDTLAIWADVWGYQGTCGQTFRLPLK